MGLIQKLAAIVGYERRDAACFDPSWAAVSQGLYASGHSPRAAENLSAVLACVGAISTALGSVPVVVYQRTATGDRIEQPNNPVALLSRVGANEAMTWPDFVEHLLASTLLTGNGLAVVLRDGKGSLSGLRFVPWNTVSIAILSSGKLAYDVSDPFTGRAQRYLEGEVLHLRARSDDGKIGRSVLSRAAETVTGVSDTNGFARSLLRNGAYPSGILSAPGAISNETAARLKQTIADGFTGPRKAGQVFVAGDGLKWSTMTISPEDAELLESRKFGVIEICRLFQVPPPLAMSYENSTFTNATQAGIWFAIFCLSSWAKKVEAEFARSVFAAGGTIEMEMDLNGFLRGDPQTRWQTYDVAVKNNILSVNEIREMEGFNAIATGGTRRR